MEVDKIVRTTNVVRLPGGNDLVEEGEKSLATTAWNEFLRKETVEVSEKEKYVPFHAIEYVEVSTEAETIEVDDDTCQGAEPAPPKPGMPIIEGANNVSIRQGVGINLRDGVTAKDGNGNVIEYTVVPDTIDECAVGVHHAMYTAEADNHITQVERRITINAIPHPVISGLEELTVEVNEEFDPLDGVSAVDGNGNPVEVTVEQPTQYVTVLEVNNYTAPNDTPMAKPTEWDIERGSNLIVEATGVVVNGSIPAQVDFAYFDGFNYNPSLAVSLDPIEGEVESGAGVWFYSDENDKTNFESHIGSEGAGEILPSTVTFERLVVKQEIQA